MTAGAGQPTPPLTWPHTTRYVNVTTHLLVCFHSSHLEFWLLGLETWLCGHEHKLHSQRTYTGLPAPTSITSVPKEPMPSSGLQGHQASMWYTNIHAGKTPSTYRKNVKITNFKYEGFDNSRCRRLFELEIHTCANYVETVPCREAGEPSVPVSPWLVKTETNNSQTLDWNKKAKAPVFSS